MMTQAKLDPKLGRSRSAVIAVLGASQTLAVELLSAGNPGRSDRAGNRRTAHLGICRILDVPVDRRARRSLCGRRDLNCEEAIEKLQQLRGRGVKLAFDDFGTGYASLSYLTHFPLTRIKVDRSFVQNIIDNAEHAPIARSLIARAHNRALAVIAEGVETDAQAAFPLKEQCGEARGFLYTKPLPAGEFEDYLKARQIASEPIDSSEHQLNRNAPPQRSIGQSPRRHRFPKV
jgi:hypothetical protein